MIVKNRPLLKIERVFVDFRKNIQNGKKKKKKKQNEKKKKKKEVMNVTLFPGVTYAIKRNAGVNKSSPRNSIPGNVALEINLSKLISRNPSRIA